MDVTGAGDDFVPDGVAAEDTEGFAAVVGVGEFVGVGDVAGVVAWLSLGANGAVWRLAARSRPSVFPAASVKKPTRSPASFTPLIVVAPTPSGSFTTVHPAWLDQVNPNVLEVEPLPVV